MTTIHAGFLSTNLNPLGSVKVIRAEKSIKVSLHQDLPNVMF